jgi:NAD+ diphosphatase
MPRPESWELMTDFAPRIDRWNARRSEPGLIEALRKDHSTRVLVVHEGAARVVGERLVYASTAEITDAEHWALLGVSHDGAPTLLAIVASRTGESNWREVRSAGGYLNPEDGEFLLMGVALSRWLVDAAYCPRCGQLCEVENAGWSRRCSGCAAQHFPRSDPAAIVAIESADGQRLLLGSNAMWQGKMFSCFAGFAEAGESLEDAVHREILEEAGVRLRDVAYVASQSWPYPHSLMVGFGAVAIDENETVPDGEEILETRWFTRAEIASSLAGDGPVGLPGRASIAHKLITRWLERE